MEGKKTGAKGALMAAAAALASAIRPGRAVPINRSTVMDKFRDMGLPVNRMHGGTPGAFGRGKGLHNPAGTKLAKKLGSLTCRHPVGTHGRTY